jgi:hypothetical protein
MEKWKDIQGYEGLYQVSNLGNVRSQYRRVVNHKSGSTRLCAGIQMTARDNGNGYLIVSLRKQGKRKNHYVHRLVAMAFVENPDSKTHINHIDFNTRNNRASNLEWCTQKENVNHSAVNMRKPKANCKLTNTGEKYIRKISSHGNTRYRVTLRRFGVDRTFKTLEEAVYFRNCVEWGVI